MAAPVNEGNILVGAGKLEIKVGAAAWKELGGTEDGVEFSLPKEFFDIKAAEAPVTLGKEVTDTKGIINTQLLESTLDNLLLVWPGTVVGNTLTVSVTNAVAPVIQFRFTGKAPNGLVRTVLFPSVKAISDGAHRRTKGANTSFAVEFEALPIWNTAQDRWDFGTMVDAVA